MNYRTKTYIAGDWTGDEDAIQKLYDWKNDNNLLLDFVDAHEFTQARDSSYPCSIKSSLRTRLSISKTFVLIVGSDTKSLTKGSCRYCESYNSYTGACARNGNVDFRSFIEYECEMAIKDYLAGEIKKIVVLYNYSSVRKEKCPDCIKNIGNHVAMGYLDENNFWKWNYPAVKNALID